MEKKQVIDEVKKLKKKVRNLHMIGTFYRPSLMDESWNNAIEAVLDLLREY